MLLFNLHHNIHSGILTGHAGAEFACSTEEAEALRPALEPFLVLPAAQGCRHSLKSRDEEAVHAWVGAPPFNIWIAFPFDSQPLLLLEPGTRFPASGG